MSDYKITSYNFFRTPHGAEFVKNGELYQISKEVLDCMISQYQLMGFQIIFNNECFISVAKVENAVEVFLDRLNKK